MKKYLLTSIAAVALASVFTGCSKVDEITLSDVTAQQKSLNYQKAFVEHFGPIDANQTWGFGNVTRTENANANEWADPNKAYGGLKVPPPLTTEQKAVVKKYFQTHPNLGYQDPQWTDYFIQQVYKGHTDVPANCATPEEYTALNGTTKLIASDYMDHLAAIDGTFFDHINNFNHGDCSENYNVLDNGGNANNGPFHTDKIMYMKESTTKSFGYFNSNGSLCHTKYTGLVSYKTIMNAMGAEADCLEDGWNRSYMGFDFEQMVDDQCYATNWEDGSFKNLTIWDECYINGVKQSNYVYQYNGQPVKVLSDQTNRYCGTLRTVSDSELYTEERDANNNNAYLGKALNTTLIDGLLAQGYLPIDNKNLREWALVGGCADGYFSDWIVTLTKAETTTEIIEEKEVKEEGMVICEDLGNIGDFDFNDVVFEATIYTDNSCHIKLLAAGGVLPIYVAGVDVNEKLGKMINTGMGTHAPYEFDTTQPYSRIKDIPITVKQVITKEDGAEEILSYDLTAEVGKAPQKILVAKGYKWCDEYVSIEKAYPGFINWVSNAAASSWTGNYVERLVDLNLENNTAADSNTGASNNPNK